MSLCRIDNLGALAVQEISGGQYQRASIARALATDAELLFLDEPTTFLDHDSRLGVRKVIEDILKEGKVALAIVSHDAALFDLCSRLWYFFDGTVQATSPEAER
jgi:ABC-type cobalamin/Fe3+-siderophores transport system ATPase subunit